MSTPPKEIRCNDLMELGGNIAGTVMMAQMQLQHATPEQKSDIIKAKLQPYVNLHNIKLLFSDKNIAWVQNKLPELLPKLEKPYILHGEVTSDLQDVLLRIASREPDGTALPIGDAYLGKITQQQILDLILKFMPKNVTGEQQ